MDTTALVGVILASTVLFLRDHGLALVTLTTSAADCYPLELTDEPRSTGLLSPSALEVGEALGNEINPMVFEFAFVRPLAPVPVEEMTESLDDLSPALPSLSCPALTLFQLLVQLAVSLINTSSAEASRSYEVIPKPSSFGVRSVLPDQNESFFLRTTNF